MAEQIQKAKNNLKPPVQGPLPPTKGGRRKSNKKSRKQRK